MNTTLKSTLTAALIAAVATPSLAGGPVLVAEDEAVAAAPREGVNPVLVLAIIGIAAAIALADGGSDGPRNSWK